MENVKGKHNTNAEDLLKNLLDHYNNYNHLNPIFYEFRTQIEGDEGFVFEPNQIRLSVILKRLNGNVLITQNYLCPRVSDVLYNIKLEHEVFVMLLNTILLLGMGKMVDKKF